MKLRWDGEPQYAPGLGLTIQPGEHEYPDEAVETLRAIGLKEPAAEPLAPARRRATKGDEE